MCKRPETHFVTLVHYPMTTVRMGRLFEATIAEPGASQNRVGGAGGGALGLKNAVGRANLSLVEAPSGEYRFKFIEAFFVGGQGEIPGPIPRYGRHRGRELGLGAKLIKRS
jgi:hypothetical protein